MWLMYLSLSFFYLIYVMTHVNNSQAKNHEIINNIIY